MSSGPVRLPADAGIGAVRLRVADLDRSLDFYAELLGFRPLERTKTTASLGVEAGPPLIRLEAVPGTVRRPPRTLGLYHFAILYPDRRDLGRVLLRCFERRIPFDGFADHDVSEAAYLPDPDGNGVELYADRPRHQWRRAEGEIVMVTEVLNVTGLLRAVDGDPWIGPPAGTRIGHVHLHVGALAPAVAFYRDELGLDVTNARYPGATFLSAGGYHHHLALNTWAAGSGPAPGDVAGLIDFELDVPDTAERAALRVRLEANGRQVESEDDGFATLDPEGNRVRIR